MKIHRHTDDQNARLDVLIQETALRILGMQFNDPANDSLMIRQHAALNGQLQILQQLRADNYPDPEAEFTQTPIHTVSEQNGNF